MIDYFFGKPRTGKTYRAVNIIYDEYIKDSSYTPKFTNILTNIGGFKFKEVNQHFRDLGSKSIAYKLIWNDFYTHLSKLHKMALEDKSDEELNRYAYSHKINDCLIVLDEASLYMKRYDDVISWYLAYHGHFKVRIIIIAQSPKQINAEYLVHAEIYCEAQPQSKQLSNNKLRYIFYSEPYFNKDSKFSTDSITSNTKIYDLYKSGEVDKPKKMLYKFIFFMILALIAMIFFFKLLLYKLTGETPLDDSNTTNINNLQTTIQNQNISQNQNLYNQLLLTLRCDDKYCWNIDDKYQNKQLTLTHFKTLVLNFDLELFYSEVKNEIFTFKKLNNHNQKITIAKLTDYTYKIPKEFKNTYLKDFYIPNIQENKIKTQRSIQISPFSGDESFNSNDERISEEERMLSSRGAT